MNYGGDPSCAPSVTGPKTLEIAAQVAGPGPSHGFNYHTITGSTLSTSSTISSYLSLYTGRTVYIVHPYRVIAIGTGHVQGQDHDL
jgi:hypothetical protein